MDASPIPMVRAIALVFVGGGTGSVLRFAVSEGVRRVAAAPLLPWGTLTVNVLGSLALGWFLARSTGPNPSLASASARAFIAIGLLGGFTTFSAFSGEVLAFLYSSQYARAAGYAALSVALAVAAAMLGFTLARAAS